MNNTVSTPKPLVKSKCCGSDMVSTGSGEGTYFWICLSCQKPCDPSETDESPVESVSQPKAVDGYLKEFDYMERNHGWIPEHKERVKDFIRSSIERARREERNKNFELAWKNMNNTNEIPYGKEEGEFYDGFVEGWNRASKHIAKIIRPIANKEVQDDKE